MYQEIIDGLVLPFSPDSIDGFMTDADAFWINFKDGTSFKVFDMVESIDRQEFASICIMVADKITANRLLEGGE